MISSEHSEKISQSGKINKMSIEEIPIGKLQISEFNVRKDVGDISELAAAVKEQGVLQPLLVRHEDSKYGVIIGSRRYTAAKEAELTKVPAIVKDMNDSDAMIVSLAENLQRGDLKPKETAEAIARLLKTSTLRELGKKLGKSYVYVQNFSRLVNLVNTLGKHNVNIDVLPSDRERELGRTLPLNHGIHLANTLEYTNVRDFFESLESDQAEELTVQVAKAIAPIKQTDAQKVLEIFKRQPSKPIDVIVEEVEAGDLPDFGGTGTVSGTIHEMPADSFEDQIHHKLIWNLKRTVEEYDFYTIGYSHASTRHFIQRLQAKGVKTVVDIRKNAASMYKLDFVGSTLKRILHNAGIEYVHLPDWGIPKEEREDISDLEDFKQLWKWYDKNVLSNLDLSQANFHTLLENAGVPKKGHPVAFMCAEFDPTRCHRHRLSLGLENKGMRSIDL